MDLYSFGTGLEPMEGRGAELEGHGQEMARLLCGAPLGCLDRIELSLGRFTSCCSPRKR